MANENNEEKTINIGDVKKVVVSLNNPNAPSSSITIEINGNNWNPNN